MDQIHPQYQQSVSTNNEDTPKTKKTIRSDLTPERGTTYEAIKEDTHEWQRQGHEVPISYRNLSVSQQPMRHNIKQGLTQTPSS